MTGKHSKMAVGPFPKVPAVWLTATEKIALMKRLECDELRGKLDVDSILPLRRLNTLSGLASAFSCMGHQERARLGGYLVLRTNRTVAERLDTKVISALWKKELIYHAQKDWQRVRGAAGRSVSRVSYTLRFHVGFLEKVCEAIYQLVKES